VADRTAKKTKRRVKNPETFRERALKATEGAESGRQGRLKRFVVGAISPIVGPVAKAASKFFSAKPFRPVRRVLRVVGKIIFPVYFRHSWQELRLVTWPNWRESRRLTFAVLVFAIVFGAAIAGVDYGLDKVFRDLLLK